MNSTLLITSELTNQRARKALFTCVVYTKARYSERARKIYFCVDDKSDKKMSHGQGKEEKTRKAKKTTTTTTTTTTTKEIGPNPKQKRYQEKETTIRACNLELRGSWIRIPSGAQNFFSPYGQIIFVLFLIFVL